MVWSESRVWQERAATPCRLDLREIQEQSDLQVCVEHEVSQEPWALTDHKGPPVIREEILETLGLKVQRECEE